MFKHNYWVPFAVIICIYLMWSAEHLTGPKDKLKRIWRNRVSTQKENTTLLRSTSNRTTASKQENYNSPINKEEINLLKRGPYEKCDNIYVDLGSNIGVQIRKLFEPLKYPKSKILNSYNDILGDVVTRRESVCAFGFEANPRHFKRLRQVQDIYNALGWKTTFYNRVVWTENNDTMTIYSDDENRNEDWGAGVFDTAIPDKNTMTKFEVPTVDIASWFESIIDQYSPKTVMVKMDIEGSEYKVIPHLLRRNMLCADKISYMYMEFHNWAANGQLLNRNIVREQMASQNCVSTLLIHVDDETYLHDGMEFPTIDIKGNETSMGPSIETTTVQIVKESHDGDLIIADIFLDTKNETIAIVNSKRNVWTYKRHVKRAWTCKDIQTGLVVNGKVLPIETHGHSMVVSFGKQFVEGVQIQVSNGISEYEVRTLKRSLLNGRQFNLVAAIFISKELDQIGILERWVDWHSSMGVEHTLVYVNRKYDQPERLYMRFPNNVTFVPFWFNHDISFGDQQVQNMHALYTLKGVSKWMLSTDVDEYVICRDSLLNTLKGQSPIAFQLSSYTVDNDGHISDRPQYGSDLKGKVILNTDLATGHSVHMVTDANGGRPILTDMVKGNHFNVSPDVCRIAHFKRTVEVTRQIENVSEQVYPGQSLQKLVAGQNIIATIESSAEQIWTCGWQTKPLYNHAFKNATYGGIYSGKSNDDDILLYDFGPCSHPVGDFKGTIYWFDGENHQSFTSKLRPNDVYFGGKQVSVPSVEWAFVATASIGMGVVDKILASVRPAEVGKEFLFFMASNCVAHRKKAFEQIASIDIPTAGGSCGGYTVKYKTLTTPTKDWSKNTQFYKNYKFALVMENSVAPGYITEKIVIAFMAGSIPIYYGDRTTVEKWFNPKAFIFYDPNNPEEALKKIRRLHHDDKAYFKMRNMPMIRSPTIPTLKQKLTQTAFPTPKAPRNVYFITYANSKYERAKKRIVKEAHNSNWFIRARGFGPGDLSKTFRDKYSHVLSRNRGGGYWIWKYAIIEETLKTMNTGDYLVYADAGSSINQHGKERFDEYIDMLEASDMDIISFNMPFHQEHTWTTEHIFKYFNISANDRIRTSGQHIATVLILQKGPHLRKWLDLINRALEEDALMFTDEYNADTKYTGFKDNRHDQSVSSVTRKIVRSIVIPDDTYPPNQKEFPIWASRSKN